MNYQRIYDNLVSYRQSNPASGYTERHHIVMKSMGGSDAPSNLVVLTGREHWIAHLLLYKIHKNSKTIHACRMMGFKSKTNSNRASIKNSRMYEHIREQFSRSVSSSQSGKGNSQYGKIWIYSDDLKQTKRIDHKDSVPQGWKPGYKLFNRKVYQSCCCKCNNVYETTNLRRKYCQRCLSPKTHNIFQTKQKRNFIWMSNGFINYRILEDMTQQRPDLIKGKISNAEIASRYISLYKEFKEMNCSLGSFVKRKSLPISFMTLKNNFIRFCEYEANDTKHSRYKKARKATVR